MPDQAIVKFFAYAAVETLGDDWASAAPHLEWFAVSRGVAIDVKRFKKEASRLHTDRVDHTLMQTLRAHSRGTAFDLDDVDSMDPYDFEEFVSNLYAAQGYRTAPTQRSGDQGADVLLERLGAQTAVQVKLYSGPVGNKAVQEAIAAREFYGCSDATVVTNSTYTRSAQELAARCRVTLVDREDLQDMIDCYNAGSAVDRATAEHRPPRRHPPREAQLPTQG